MERRRGNLERVGGRELKRKIDGKKKKKLGKRGRKRHEEKDRWKGI